jgi:cephalosporin-C deacetylase
MPGVDMPMADLKKYTGSFPKPADFEVFWKKAMDKIIGWPVEICQEEVGFSQKQLQYRWISIRATDGCILRAKYICPAGNGKLPVMIQFHDYPMASRSWFHLSRYASVGYAVLAPDCRGQGGMSEAGLSGKGPTAFGPLFQGLEDVPEKMYIYQLIEDALLWIKAVQMIENVDNGHLAVYGEGQGGGLALACAALYPEIRKCAAHYPMLCDYKRVWDKDFDVGAYEGLRYFFRWKDPMHEKETEIFEKLAYMDVKNFAPMIQAQVLVSTGLQDTVSPPSAQFAVVNALQCPKKHVVYPKHGHELNNFFENELLKFILFPG